jgi:hypothetical protein
MQAPRRDSGEWALWMRATAPLGKQLAHRKAGSVDLIRIGRSAWRVGPRPQPANRRTIAATSASGKPTGQAADAASRSGSSPATSEDASPNRA